MVNREEYRMVQPTRRFVDEELARLKARNAELTEILEAALHCVRSYQYGNSAPALAEEMGDAIEKVLKPA